MTKEKHKISGSDKWEIQATKRIKTNKQTSSTETMEKLVKHHHRGCAVFIHRNSAEQAKIKTQGIQ
jgi:hypothetical protein